jgi:hypothetical protein
LKSSDLAAVIGLAVACVACSDPASVAPGELVGSWDIVTAQQPQGSMRQVLMFESDGTVIFGVYHYGVYTASSGLEAYSEIEGRYTTTGDRLEIDANRITLFDTFYHDPGPTTGKYRGTIFDDCTFRVEGDQLTLTYLSYPLDAPEETVLRLRRAR